MRLRRTRPLPRCISPWLMWLALLLPLAQSLAAVHAVSHIAAEARDDTDKSSAPLVDHCPQCGLAAALGNGAPLAAQVAWVAPALRYEAPPRAAARRLPRLCATPYQSRAPPFLA